ncbi:hypothetical protein [Streptomyces sp. NPDC057557]|uniref:hypothetical protein n=1 Tax=Streptomyces sp. NPDC057557 TaxID=3346167 RepID=UPI00369D822C
MSFPTPIPVEIPGPPAETTQPLPPVGSTVTYTLSTQDLISIAEQAQAADSPYPEFVEGEPYPAIVTTHGTGTQLTLRVLLVEDATITMWALLRPEGDGPGTWSRPTT